MPRSHWVSHVLAAMADYPTDGRIQRQGASILAALGTIRENSTDATITLALDDKQADRVLLGRDAQERDEIREWMALAERPSNLHSSMERRIREARSG